MWVLGVCERRRDGIMFADQVLDVCRIDEIAGE